MEEIIHFDIINKWLSIRYIDSKNSDLNSEHLLKLDKNSYEPWMRSKMSRDTFQTYRVKRVLKEIYKLFRDKYFSVESSKLSKLRIT